MLSAGSGLEMPKVNVRVCGYEMDDYWPEYQLVLELDGGAFHSDPMAIKLDAVKKMKLQANGLSVIRVRKDSASSGETRLANETRVNPVRTGPKSGDLAELTTTFAASKDLHPGRFAVGCTTPITKLRGPR